MFILHRLVMIVVFLKPYSVLVGYIYLSIYTYSNVFKRDMDINTNICTAPLFANTTCSTGAAHGEPHFIL
jgi:hypothetical protein